MQLSGTLTAYTKDGSPVYTVKTNCAHVAIKDRCGNVVFDRGTIGEKQTIGDDWLDKSHRRIADALQELEYALIAVCPG